MFVNYETEEEDLISCTEKSNTLKSVAIYCENLRKN